MRMVSCVPLSFASKNNVSHNRSTELLGLKEGPVK